MSLSNGLLMSCVSRKVNTSSLPCANPKENLTCLFVNRKHFTQEYFDHNIFVGMIKFIRFITSKIRSGSDGQNDVGACGQQEQQLHITDLPTEVLALIFEYCSYNVLAGQVRLVCKRFCDVATLVLNWGFSTLGPKIDRATVEIVPRMGQVQTKEERRATNRVFIALMIMKCQYRLLRAVTWRHICNPYSGSGHLECFYGGSLLDEFLRFLQLAHECPKDLGDNLLYPDYKNEVDILNVRCLIFTNHFEKTTEKLNNNYSISGAKLIDLFDCLVQKDGRTIPYEQAVTANGTECHIKARYRMPYTWFCSLPSSHAQPNKWNEKQRPIYLRMCQLINGRNHFFLEKIHHEKELLIRKGRNILILKYILPSLYYGFRQNFGCLFFYGTMKLLALDLNFHEELTPAGQLFDYFNLDFLTSHNEADTSDGVVNVPEPSKMDLNIDIELHSPLKLAPIKCWESSQVRIATSADVAVVWGYDHIFFC
ncbi:uncharacterized protein LOC110826878 [Zootermopsis nevadensis]|uniref:F-box domain-containing protein n=1 Tax=Zootermopsis nevadensis TaxID=136037 RepID=A0A067RHD5_ZOONE|nr:uncharacterized protein LOC110826878 [Zootermopsis nevadensis]KDR22458.1 hypothetical protein L798_01454 [Zootermopsis nevadensis]